MAATDPQSLVAQGKCYACFSANQFQIMKLALLAQIAVSAATDPQSLLAQAKCYMCFGVSMAEAMELALLADIAVSGGGGGGGTATIVTTTDPVNGSSAGLSGQFWWNTVLQKLWINQTGTNAGWVQLI